MQGDTNLNEGREVHPSEELFFGDAMEFILWDLLYIFKGISSVNI